MEITTRRATVADAEAIATAHMRAWQVAYEGIVDQGYLDGINLDDRIKVWQFNLECETLPNGLAAPTDYVAEVDGKVAGFANVGVWRGNGDDASLGELWAMYVHPDYWGAGLGYRLMNDTMEHFRQTSVSTGYLWVLEDNAPARRFYERQGWSADDVVQEDDVQGQTILERRYSIELAQK